MFIPGDNDIGGEGWDRVTPEKVERFEWAFHAPIEDEEIFKFITFDRANIMPGTFEINFITRFYSKISKNISDKNTGAFL